MAIIDQGGLTPAGEIVAGAPVGGRLSDLVYQLRGNPATFAGLGIVGLIVVAAVLGPIVAPYDPYHVDLGSAALPPSLAHPFGTDQYGQNVLTRVMVAARLDLVMALSAVVLSMTVGVLLGALSGFFGRWLDEGIMRTQD